MLQKHLDILVTSKLGHVSGSRKTEFSIIKSIETRNTLMENSFKNLNK